MATTLTSEQAKHLGAQLKLARQGKSMSIEEVADRCQMHYTQLSRLERGQFKRLSGNVQIACAFLHISPHHLLAPGESLHLHARLDALINRGPESLKVLLALFDALDALPPPA